jgi:hypothetical protein
MKYLKTYEFFGIFKKKEDKPRITWDDLQPLYEDCILPLKDVGFDITTNGRGVSRQPFPVSSTEILHQVTIRIEKDTTFGFEDIKHEISQFCSMVNEYDVEISLDAKFSIYNLKWGIMDKEKKINPKDIMRGKYDKTSLERLNVIILIPNE